MEPPSSPTVSIVNRSGHRAPRALLTRAVSLTLERHRSTGGEVCVLLTGVEEMQALNRQFRSVDQPTDVLTFAADPAVPAAGGDVAISVPFARRQAKARGVSLAQELGFLAIHGALHLVGFDDERAADRRVMVREMNRAAVAAGLRPDAHWSSLLHAEPRS